MSKSRDSGTDEVLPHQRQRINWRLINTRDLAVLISTVSLPNQIWAERKCERGNSLSWLLHQLFPKVTLRWLKGRLKDFLYPAISERIFSLAVTLKKNLVKMNNKLQIFKEHLLPVFKEKFGESVFFDEQNSLVKFYENGKFVLQFYPIGNVLMMPGGVWIKERAVDYLFDKMLDGPNPELRALLYPFQDPQIKKAKLTKKRKKIESISETLTVVGGGFSEENLSKKHTLAFAKMADLLECCGIPHIKEFPVVVKRSAENKGLPKLYLLDFYIPPPFSFIIEVDGGYHSTPEQIEYDRIRDISIKAKGIGKTIRFSNEVILNRRFELLPSLMKEKIFQESLSRYRTQLSRREF